MEEAPSRFESVYPEFFKLLRRRECGLVYVSYWRHFALRVRARTGPIQKLAFCPFSGKKFPAGVKDEFFDEMERLGIDYFEAKRSAIPQEFRSEKWWMDREL